MEETPPDSRKWYQKKRYVIPAALIGLSFVFGGDTSNSTVSPQPQTYQVGVPINASSPPSVIEAASDPVVQKSIEVEQTREEVIEFTSSESQTLSNDNYYTNVDGDQIHSPAYTSDDSVPDGASARCSDGTYSFSANRRGTCSHHGGVAEWL